MAVQQENSQGSLKNKLSNSNLMWSILGIVVVGIWGLTFISLKVAGEYFTPPQVMFVRCVIAYISLLIIYPKIHKPESFKQELVYFFAGLFGTTLYITLVNTAYEHTQVVNVSVLSSTSPIFIALLAPLFFKDAKLRPIVFLGFAVATIGTILVATNGDFSFEVSFLGDFIALGTAISWALYSNILKLNKTKYPQLYTTRRVFFYGILCVIPIMLVQGDRLPIEALAKPSVLLNMLFLGLVAYTFCHVGWGLVVRHIGAVKAGNFMYLTPVITMIFSSIFLNETVSLVMIAGTIFILLGVSISDGVLVRAIKKYRGDNTDEQQQLAE